MLSKLTNNMRGLAFTGAAVFAAAAATAPAPVLAAEEVYIATDYDGGDADHGFWSNPKNKDDTGVDDAYFSFDEGKVVFTLDEMADFASIVGEMVNSDGVKAYLDILFTGYSDALPNGKTFKDGSGTGPGDADFFTSVSGTITIDGTVYTVDDFAGSTQFQYGFGATDKNPPEYGGSAWLLLSDANGQRLDHHVDLNFALVPAVPEPETWLMMLIGFFGVGSSLRRSRRMKVRGAMLTA